MKIKEHNEFSYLAEFQIKIFAVGFWMTATHYGNTLTNDFIMGRTVILGKQAKILTTAQAKLVLAYLSQTRHPARNKVIFLLSLRAGLRAKEIASITWSMVLDAEGILSNVIRIEDSACKGRSGGKVPMADDLRNALQVLLDQKPVAQMTIVCSERAESFTAQSIVNLFRHWYQIVGFEGCSSHSGRRTFITNAARNIGRFGGSIRDVQALARHRSLSMTQNYIEIDNDALSKVVNI